VIDGCIPSATKTLPRSGQRRLVVERTSECIDYVASHRVSFWGGWHSIFFASVKGGGGVICLQERISSFVALHQQRLKKPLQKKNSKKNPPSIAPLTASFQPERTSATRSFLKDDQWPLSDRLCRPYPGYLASLRARPATKSKARRQYPAVTFRPSISYSACSS